MKCATSCVVLIALLQVVIAGTPPVISIQNNRLFLDGTEFIIKGVAYSPSPIGQKYMSSTGYGGTGFCSSKITPWLEWKSACYDSDYYDGSPDIYTPSRFPTGFRPLWERDFPYIKAIGANTIRLYNTNPSTLAATKEYTNLFNVSAGKDHTQFIKYCEDNNLKVIFPLFSDEKSYLNMDENVFRRYVRWQIDEVGGSPAVIMWQLGNEQGWAWYGTNNLNWNSSVYTAKLNRMLNYIRTYTKTKWNRFIPVTSTIVNIDKQYDYQYANWAVDVFTSNVFGTNFDYIFDGDSNTYGVTALSCAYNKPFLMTETGPTWKPGQPYTKGAINQIWSDVIRNIPNGALGGVYFEQTDEPAKGKDFGLFSLSVATNSAGQSSDQQDVFIADKITTKQQYTDIYGGYYNNIAYNYRTDVFSLLKRSPYTTSNVPDTCASRYTLRACPGTTWPRCSGNGLCNRNKGTCTCLPGWYGTSCNTPTCSCNSRGVCNTAVYPIECACNPGFWGSSCQYTIQTNVCPSLNGMVCTNGNGICVNGACKCFSGWTGVDCGVTDPGYGSINIQQNFVGCLQGATFEVTAPASQDMTNQQCRYWCALQNYTYAATTTGNTCMCGDTLSTTTTSTSCTAVCMGDAQQKCGGTGTQSTYFAGDLTSLGYLGCFVDNSTRDLPTTVSASDTIPSCRQACSAAGFTYAGLQAGGECRCGNAYGRAGGKTLESECNVACMGDSTTTCGGTWRNSIYTASLPTGYQYY